MGKDPDSKIQKSKKSKKYRCAPKVLDFLDLHCGFGVFWIFPKKYDFFLEFQGFCFWKILKFQKNLLFFFDFPAFLEKSKKTQGCFWILNGFTRKIQKKLWFFLFSRFLLLENLENPKKLLFFLDFPAFLEKKNTRLFLDFKWFYSKNQKKPMVFFFDFQGFCFWKILKFQKNILFFFDFPAFLEKSKKKPCVFLDFSRKAGKIQKKHIVFFGFSRFSKTKNLEIPKKNHIFLEKSKKHQKTQCKSKKSKTFGAHLYFLDFLDFWILESGSLPILNSLLTLIRTKLRNRKSRISNPRSCPLLNSLLKLS